MSSAVEEEGVSATDEREGAEGEEEEQEHDESSEESSSEESGAEDDGAEDGGPEDEEEEDEAAAALPISKEQQEAEEEDLGKVCFICHANGVFSLWASCYVDWKDLRNILWRSYV